MQRINKMTDDYIEKKCLDSCCTLKICKYQSIKDPFEKIHRYKRKAGAFIYDPNTDKVLLIQSRGHLWGPPKGTMNYSETDMECAIREVKEETGLDISCNNFTSEEIVIRNRATYWYIQLPECEVIVQNHIPGNDANGICWIKLACLEKLIDKGIMMINQHCRIVFKRFLDKSFPSSTPVCNNFSIIATVLGPNMGIGIGDKLPWEKPDTIESNHFRDITKGGGRNAIIMGRTTWESVTERYMPLEDRLNIVISKNPDRLCLPPYILSFPKLSQAINVLSQIPTINNIFVIGGEQLYKEAICHPNCEKLYIIHMDNLDIKCDKFFPEIFSDIWKIEDKECQNTPLNLIEYTKKFN